VRLPGALPLDEIEPLLGTVWSEATARTVGGHIADVAGRIPTAGEVFAVDGVTVEVERTRRHAIVSVLVTPPPRSARDGSGS
jgi:CBS domain containing-hemolysin-like protein